MLREKLSQNYGANNLIHQKTKKKTEPFKKIFFYQSMQRWSFFIKKQNAS
jgi:hypothetical protein